jgi:hypothetical protein
MTLALLTVALVAGTAVLVLGFQMLCAGLDEGAKPRAVRDEGRGWGLWMMGSVFLLVGGVMTAVGLVGIIVRVWP